ncbi:MAG: RagB/SusD family nutrient uptake outer membrane protein, partial [Bacteroidales bacterium]
GWYRFETSHVLWKYVGTEGLPSLATGAAATGYRTGNKESDANWIIYRYPDVLLMKAEALVQQGALGEAVDLVNIVRERALVEPISNIPNKQDLEERILEERAKEFCGEGKRWFDLIRMARRNNNARTNLLIEILSANKTYEEAEIIRSKYSNPDSWFLPIYQGELDQNDRLKQNPYYVNQ